MLIKRREIKKIPLINKINRFFVALELSAISENGLGWMRPFKASVYFAISIEFFINSLNSSPPIIKYRLIQDRIIKITNQKSHLYFFNKKKVINKKINKKFKYNPFSILSNIENGDRIPKIKILK